MRLLVIAGSFHPEIGGPPRYLEALARALVGRGHEVTVLCMSPPGTQVPDSHYPYRVVRISRALPVVLRLATMLAAIVRHGRKTDLWFVSDYGAPVLVASWLVRRPILIKIVGDFAWEYGRRHGLTHEDFDRFQTQPLRGRLRWIKRLQRAYVARARAVLVPSAYLSRIVAGWGIAAERVRVIPNAVDLGAYELPEPEVARRELGLPARYLLIVARLAPWKGIDEVMRALPGLDGEIHLVVAGEGPERAALEALAEQLGVAARVRLVGAVAPARIGAYLRGAEAMVLYTGYEGLSHVLIEALGAGTPIVASDKGGNPEVVTDGASGLLVPYGDPRALAAALARITGDSALRARLAAGARAASAAFDWPRLVDRTEALMREVVGLAREDR